jgi:hypothetical protein
MSRRLQEEFDMDIYTGLKFADLSEWGIRKVIDINRPGFLDRLAHAFDQRSVWLREMLDFKKFFQRNELHALYDLFLEVRLRQGQSNAPLTYWNLVGRTPLNKIIKTMLSPFPRFGTLARLVKNGEYDLVLTTHPMEGENTAAGIVAKRHNTLLVCVPMGVDNMQNAPMQMDPDLFVLWGPEQENFLVRHHTNFRQSLKNSRHEISGAIPHDSLISADQSTFDAKYPEIRPDATVVMFAAYTEAGYPGQAVTCELILSIFDTLGIDGHLIVRMRAGRDKQVWDEFLALHPDKVTIQDPEGVLYSKWDTDRQAIKSVEQADYDLYGATLKRSTLVVAASFSTVIFDATAVGKPALASGLTTDYENRTVFRDHYKKCADIIPALGFLDLIVEERRFVKQATHYLTTDKIAPDQLPNYSAYLEQVTPSNGLASKTAIDAILNLVSQHQNNK